MLSSPSSSKIKDFAPSMYGKVILWTIKLGLVCSIAYLIYDQIIVQRDIDSILVVFRKSYGNRSTLLLLVCIALMPVNWYIESAKWRRLISTWRSISQWLSMKAIYAGISLGIVTPARLGEYGGRLLVLDKKDRMNSLSATLLSSISQNIANLTGGLIGAVIFCSCYFSIHHYVLLSGSILGLLGIMLIWWLYLHIGSIDISRWMSQKWMKMLRQQARVISLFDQDVLLRVLHLSIGRYLIYSTQYVLILYYVGVDIPLLAAVTGVAVIYLLQSGIPLPPMLSVIARGELAIIIWSLFSDNIGGILAATFGLWVLNLLLPALLGLLIVLNVSAEKTSENDGH